MARTWASLLLFMLVLHYSHQVKYLPIIDDHTTDVHSSDGLTITPIATQAITVEYSHTADTNSRIKLPCRAQIRSGEIIKYKWLKWKGKSIAWQPLQAAINYQWIEEAHEQSQTGMLTISPFNKTSDAGAYICHASTANGSTSVSGVFNLTAASFPNEGKQATSVKKDVPMGTYVKLDVPQFESTPQLLATWTRTGTVSVTSSGTEIPPDRIQMDETGALHIGYMDSSLVLVPTPSGLSNLSFYHYKAMSKRFVMTDLAVYHLTTAGVSQSHASCNLAYQTKTLHLVHGQKSRIVCVYSGTPFAKVSYKKQAADGKMHPLTTMVVSGDSNIAYGLTGLYGNTYSIGSAKTSDAGKYSCSATYPGGTCDGDVQPITVTVDMEPNFVAKPPPVVYVTEGRSITLQWRIKAIPKPSIIIGQDGQMQLANMADKVQTAEHEVVDPFDNVTVLVRTYTFKKAQLTDSHVVQVYAINPYHIAVSNVALTVISPVTITEKMPDRLSLQPGERASFSCFACSDGTLPITITWTRFFAGVTWSIISGIDNEYFTFGNENTQFSGLKDEKCILETLYVSTGSIETYDLDALRGQYVCNASNGIVWDVEAARLSFFGDDPVTPSFELWMLGPILGGAAALLLVTAAIAFRYYCRGEKYNVAHEERKKGIDRKEGEYDFVEYQRDRERSNENVQASNAYYESDEVEPTKPAETTDGEYVNHNQLAENNGALADTEAERS